MALISNQFDGLFGGVNQQSAEQRLNTQVEDMTNAYPTLDRGLLKRNPTRKLNISSNINFSHNMYSYAYDRGTGGIAEEKYSINILEGEMEVINILTGKVYKEGSGLTYDGVSKDYLLPFGGINGYSATSVKDNTFLTNRLMTPLLVDTATVGTSTTRYVSELNLTNSTYGPFTDSGTIELGGGYKAEYIYDATTTVIVDGQSIVIETIHTPTSICVADFHGCYWTKEVPSVLYSAYVSAVFNTLTNALGSDYIVDYSGSVISIKKLDGTAIVTTYDIVSTIAIDKTLYIASVLNTSTTENVTIGSDTHLKTGYVWLSSANPTNAYEYTVTISDAVNSKTFTALPAESTTTIAAIADLVNQINTDATFTAVGNGSVMKITSTEEFVSIEAKDSYGNQASFGWIYEVALSADLPKTIGFIGAIAKITGTGANSFASYWIEYTGSNWKETKDPSISSSLDATTMPHVLVRNSNDSFTFMAYDGWTAIEIGDSESNPTPSFIQTTNNTAPTIKDIFLFKNRLGFVTERTVVLSEVGEYGNFWRTTAATILDSDYIDVDVDTTKAISLEYATYLEDSMMLFSDKAQFKLDGGKVLSPKDIQITQTNAYEININVRPLFMNNKVFFCSNRGEYTAVMQYDVNTTNSSFEAIDITAHVQTYIPKTITRLSGSAINNMLFLTSSDADDSVWVYKYYDNGSERVQSAWFKWTYNGIVYNAFSLGKNLNLAINRVNPSAAIDWVIGAGVWNMSKVWDNTQVWVMNDASLEGVDQLEISPIFPQAYTDSFLDDFTTVGNETIIPTVIKIGEWVQGGRTGKDIRGNLKFKTVQISSEDDSEFNLVVEDVVRATTRTIASKYTVNRKPMVYGDAKNIRISITNSTSTGFRINTVSYEGALTKRDSRR